MNIYILSKFHSGFMGSGQCFHTNRLDGTYMYTLQLPSSCLMCELTTIQ